VRGIGIDHLVLIVADVERSLAWYRTHLGLEPLRLAEWRRGEVPFPSLRVDAGTIIDLVGGDRHGANVDHLCILVEGADLHAAALDPALSAEGPPRRLYGARGVGWGLYARDPDGNRIELRHYGEEPQAPR
jgi:catechol 2,3-dioxygenase-like lactoylglutathione lyase family enzyme